MVSVAPRPFTAYQFALLHLLNLLAAHASPAGDHGGEDDDTANPDHTRRAGATGSEVKEDRAEQERTHDDDDDYGDGDDDDDDNCDNDEKPLVLPQELYLNAYCFLTEQIHEVAQPSARLSDLVETVSRLACQPPSKASSAAPRPQPAQSSPGKRRQKAGVSPLSNTQQRRTSTRLASAASSPAKGGPSSAATSPTLTATPSANPAPSTSASTRILRKTPSRASLARHASFVEEDPGGDDAMSHPSSPAVPNPPPRPGPSSRRRRRRQRNPSKRLADRLERRFGSDVAAIREEGGEVVLERVADWRCMMGDLDNPNNVAFFDSSSPLGKWVRRAILNINRMSFSDMQRLLEEIVLFGGPSAGESSVSHGEQTYDKMFATPSDMPAHHNTLQYREETFEAYIRALHASDYQGALTLLHRYFDYEAGPFSGGSSANRGMRQHALLNLTAFHMQHEEYEAARLVCTEGIQISRAAGDLICLNALTSMMRRLAFEDSESSSSARTAQHSSEVGRMPGTHDAREDPGGYVPPMDQLWDVRYGLASRVPVTSLPVDLYRAKALHFSSLTQRTNLSSKERRKEKKLAASQGKDPTSSLLDSQQRKLKWNRLDMVAWLGTGAEVWDHLGSPCLAGMYRLAARLLSDTQNKHSSVIDFDPLSGSRVAVMSSTAQQLAREGHYETALALLLSEATMPLTVRDVHTWQQAIYAVLHLQASRAQLERVLSRLKGLYSPQSDYPAKPGAASLQKHHQPGTPGTVAGPTDEATDNSGLIGEVQSLLTRSEKLLDIGQSAMAYPLAMRAITVSSQGDGQALLHLNRLAHLTTARVQTAYKAADMAVKTIDEVYADILAHEGDETIARAKYVKGRSLVGLLDQLEEEEHPSLEEVRQELLDETVSLLQDSQDLYRVLGCRKELIEVLTLHAKVLHRQGRTDERDVVAKEWMHVSNDPVQSRKKEEDRVLERLSILERVCAATSAKVAASFQVEERGGRAG